ncbi:hypothetical protein GXP67_06945 [Rhodocytophaga rosea]|uniref:Uncharacterized protein n=1 Tax=Rhodocytophaga rosea TaxID=2704465 RepID=A0A6C0GF31_9BACT|nr:hypothetical protein [Rhodocytophaga rosea]QHT66414.1 hypothetical protein GXP67_06945 [Rhodocytophaga rosea]
MNINFIENLPTPYKVFHSLSEIYSFFRLHGSYQCIGGIKTYSYTLFKLIPLGGIYSQITVLNVNTTKLLELCSITRDFIRPSDPKEGFGSIYFKISQEGETKLLEAISNLTVRRKLKKGKTFSSVGAYTL